MSDDYDDDPEVIKARSDAEIARIQAEADAEVRVVQARAQLSPGAQQLDVFMKNISHLTRNAGCIFVLILITLGIIAFFAPQLFFLLGFTH